MTEPIEPCRAMRDGKMCNAVPREYRDNVGRRLVECPRYAERHDRHLEVEDWNTLQRDRLDAARWRYLMSARTDVYLVDVSGAALSDEEAMQIIDRAIGAVKETT